MKKLSEEEKTKLYEEVHPIALEYRESFIHKNEVIEDTFKTIEQLGFLLIRFPAMGENTSLSGFTIYKAPYNCIYITSRQNLGRQYLSCWHECYHIYTGEGNGISYTDCLMEDPIEYKANAFACRTYAYIHLGTTALFNSQSKICVKYRFCGNIYSAVEQTVYNRCRSIQFCGYKLDIPKTCTCGCGRKRQ